MDDAKTLAQARQWVMDTGRWTKPNGVSCPCCGRRVKVYSRPFHDGMARALVAIYQATRPGEWCQTMDLFRSRKEFSGDVGKFIHWGLVEKRPGSGRKGSPYSGYYRLTSFGRLFVEGEVSIPRNTVVYNNKLLGTEGGLITIREAFNEPFDYDKLMRPVTRQGSLNI